jgi:hypothetical protein
MYMQTKHPEMSKSLTAMVETVVSMVSIDLYAGATFGSAWCNLWLSLVQPLAHWCNLWLSLVQPLAQPGATFGSAYIFIIFTTLIGPLKVK